MNHYIPRLLAPQIEQAVKYFPVIIVTGPRQSGKTSLCRHLFPNYEYINLEDIGLRSMAQQDPNGFILAHSDNLIIDEIQHVPQLMSTIQVRVDENRERRYILTGSSNFSVLDSMSQSLAGRAAPFTLLPFSFNEIKEIAAVSATDLLMQQGQYPGVIADHIPTELFYQSYYSTYVERDISSLLRVRNLSSFDTFVRLLAARTGSEFNASALSRETAVSSTTIKEWMSLLATSYISFALHPYYANIPKRLTKMPKVYFYDTGLLCYLLGITNPTRLQGHPMRGAIFENLAISELIKNLANKGKRANSIWFYRETSGKEIDAVIENDGLELYEIKSVQTFRSEFFKNLDYVSTNLPGVKSKTVIYDGPSTPPSILNIRNI